MMEELDKRAKKEMLDELKKVMQEMMLEGGNEDSMPVAAEVSVMSAEPIEEGELPLPAPEMDTDGEESYEEDEEEEVDLSDPETLAKFKEFLKYKKEEI